MKKRHFFDLTKEGSGGRAPASFLALALAAALLLSCEESESETVSRSNRHLPDDFSVAAPESVKAAEPATASALSALSLRSQIAEARPDGPGAVKFQTQPQTSGAYELVNRLFSGDESGPGIDGIIADLEWLFVVMDETLSQLREGGVDSAISVDEGDASIVFTRLMRDQIRNNLEREGLADQIDLPDVGAALPNPALCYKVADNASPTDLNYQFRFIEGGTGGDRSAPDCSQPLEADYYEFSWNEARRRVRIELPDEAGLGLDKIFYNDNNLEMRFQSIDLDDGAGEARTTIDIKSCGLESSCIRLWYDIPEEDGSCLANSSCVIAGVADERGGILQERISTTGAEDEYYQEIFSGAGELVASRSKTGSADWVVEEGSSSDFDNSPFLQSEDLETDGSLKESEFELDFSGF